MLLVVVMVQIRVRLRCVIGWLAYEFYDFCLKPRISHTRLYYATALQSPIIPNVKCTFYKRITCTIYTTYLYIIYRNVFAQMYYLFIFYLVFVG